jgi:hypothetical protein
MLSKTPDKQHLHASQEMQTHVTRILDYITIRNCLDRIKNSPRISGILRSFGNGNEKIGSSLLRRATDAAENHLLR